MTDVTYPLDLTGTASSNKIPGELHTLTEVNAAPYRILIPDFAPFYLSNLALVHIDDLGNSTLLSPGVDYYFVLPYMAASRSIGKPVYGGLAIVNDKINGTLGLTYQILGGPWVCDKAYAYEQLLAHVYNPRVAWWDTLSNVQDTFPPTDHSHTADEIAGHIELLAKLEEIRAAILVAPNTAPASYISHLLDKGNPHGTTAADLKIPDFATDEEVLQGKPVDKLITLRQLLLLTVPN